MRRGPGRTFVVRGTWALDSRELGELRTGSAMKLVTDSNLCLRTPAHVAAVCVALGLVPEARCCLADLDDLRALSRATSPSGQVRHLDETRSERH